MPSDEVARRGTRRRLPEDLRSFLRRRVWWGVVPTLLAIGLSFSVTNLGRTDAPATSDGGDRARTPQRRVEPAPSASMAGPMRAELEAIEAKLAALRTSSEQAAGEAAEASLLEASPAILQQRSEATRAQLDVTRERMSALRARVRGLEQRLAAVRTPDRDTGSELVERRRALERQLRALQFEGKTDKHPDVRITRAELREVVQLLGETSYISRSAEEVDLSRRLQETRVALGEMRERARREEAELVELEVAFARASERATQLAELQQQRDALSAALRARSPAEPRSDDSASASVRRAASSRVAWGLVCVLLGLLVGVAAMVVRHFTDPRLYTARQLRGVLDVPVLGSIPESAGLPLDREESRLRDWAHAARGVLALGKR